MPTSNAWLAGSLDGLRTGCEGEPGPRLPLWCCLGGGRAWLATADLGADRRGSAQARKRRRSRPRCPARSPAGSRATAPPAAGVVSRFRGGRGSPREPASPCSRPPRLDLPLLVRSPMTSTPRDVAACSLFSSNSSRAIRCSQAGLSRVSSELRIPLVCRHEPPSPLRRSRRVGRFRRTRCRCLAASRSAAR